MNLHQPLPFYLRKVAILPILPVLIGSLVLLSDIRIVAQVTLDLTGTPPSCHNYTNGAVSVQASGGTAPYAYQWNTGSTYHTIYTGAGDYSVTVTDANGSTAESNYTLTAPSPLTAPVNAVGSVCDGTEGSYICDPTGGTPAYSFQWNNGETDPQVDQPPIGYLAVTVTDANGCMKVGGRNIREPMSVEVQVVDVVCPLLCDGSAEAVVTGGLSPYTFLWSNGMTSQVIFPLPPGLYTVTVTDANGCAYSASGTVYEPPPIEISFDIQNPCTGNASITADATGGTPPFSYEWSNGATGVTITGVGQGVYFVTATDANNCKKTAHVSVSGGNLNVTAIYDDATCNGLNDGIATIYVSGGMGPYTYAWPDGFSGNQQTQLGAGNYIVTVTDAGGCAATESFAIANTLTVSVELTTQNDGCDSTSQMGSATAVVTGGISPYTFQWSGFPDNDPFLTGLDAGDYTLTVTDAIGCYHIQDFTIGQNPFLQASVVATATSCAEAENGTAQVIATGGTAPYQYQWSPGIGTINDPLAAQLPVGEYVVTIEDAQGCLQTIGFEIAPGTDELSIALSTTESGCNGVDVGTAVATVSGGTAPYSFQWSNTGQTDAEVDILPPGTFTVTATDINGCFETVSGMVPPALGFDLSISRIDASCENTADGSALVIITGNAPDPVFNWSNGIQTAQVDHLAPGNYTVTVSASNGCTGIEFISIDALVSLDLSISSTESGCDNANNGTATIDISGGNAPYTYQWNDPALQQTAMATGLPAGIYQVGITESSGCSATAQVEVPQAMPFSLTAVVTDADCHNSANGAVSISITGNFALPVDIMWNTPGSELTLQQLAPGNYQCTVTDANQCQAVISTAVGAASSIAADFAYDIVSCHNGQAEITFTDLSTASSSIQNWEWSINGATVSTDPGFTMTFTDFPLDIQLLATNTENCSDASGQVADLSLLSIGIDPVNDTYCLGTSVQLHSEVTSGADVTYTWTSTGATIDDPASPDPHVTFPASGTATIGVTAINASGCSASDEISAQILDTLFAFDISLITPQQSCSDYSMSFAHSNTTGTAYTWIFGDPANPLGTSSDPEPVFVFPGAGQQVVTVVPDAACMEPVSFWVDLSPPAEAAFNYTTEDCSETITLGFSDISSVLPVTWSWDFGNLGTSSDQHPVLTVPTTQIVQASLIATFENGCTDTVSQAIPVTMFNPELPPASLDVCAGTSTGLNPGFDPEMEYQWSPGGSTDPNPVVVATVSTSYSVTISDGNGCAIVTSVALNVPPPVEIQISDDVVACDESPAILEASSPQATTFIWSEDPDFIQVIGNQATLSVIPGDPDVYYVQATDAYGCHAVATVEVGLYAPDFVLSPADTVCSGSSAEVVLQNLDPDQVLTTVWDPYDPTAMPITLDNVFTLLISNQYGCEGIAELSVEVIDMELMIDALADPDTIQKGGSSQILTTFSDKYTYLWSPADFLSSSTIHNPVAKPEETTTYCVTVTDDHGCEAERCVTIVVINPPCQEPNLYLPNAFTPDGDGLNDELYLFGEQVDEMRLIIYNRWGEKVFESFNQSFGWDGTHRGKPVGPDVYGFYLEVLCVGGDQYFKKGNITVLR